MAEFNGKRITLTVAGVVAVLAAVFTAGINYHRVEAHVDDTVVHETPMAKTMRIDERIKFRIDPVLVQLSALQSDTDRIEKKLDRLLEKE